MCGIVGFVGSPEGVDPEAALAALRHRGPDAEGSHRATLSNGQTLWLGHRRLSIVDLSDAGRQPMEGPGGRHVVVFNGEVYNFRALRDELGAQGYTFRSGTDTEVLLAAFDRWGLRCLERLRGMFAFALWDRTTETLTLARDRLGEKPLYYVHDGARFAFASEVGALLEGGFAERELDDDGLDALLTFGSVAEPYTLVHGVRSVGAGEVVTLRGGDLTRRRYWALGAIDPSGRGREEAVAGVRARLSRSLAQSMMADVPVAVLLSGGVDSSANVVLLAAQRWDNLATFSVTFGGVDRALSEKPYSDLVARRFGTRHTSVEVSLDDARSLVPRALDAMDQPSVDGVNVFLVSDAIARAGIKVAVSGQGSDELFLGYPQRRRFAALLGANRALPAVVRHGLRALARSPLVPPDGPWDKALQTLGASTALAGAYLAQHSMFAQSGVERLRGAPRPAVTRFVEPMTAGLGAPSGGGHPLDLLSRMELAHYLRNTLLRDGDAMSMAHSIEVRAPYLDADLVEFVVSTSPRHKLDPRRNKALLLDAVGPALPREVWDRPKMGFGLPYQRWLREGLDLAEVVGPEVGLCPRAVAAVRDRFGQGQHYARWLTLLAFARWARRTRMGTARLTRAPGG